MLPAVRFYFNLWRLCQCFSCATTINLKTICHVLQIQHHFCWLMGVAYWFGTSAESEKKPYRNSKKPFQWALGELALALREIVTLVKTLKHRLNTAWACQQQIQRHGINALYEMWTRDHSHESVMWTRGIVSAYLYETMLKRILGIIKSITRWLWTEASARENAWCMQNLTTHSAGFWNRAQVLRCWWGNANVLNEISKHDSQLHMNFTMYSGMNSTPPISLARNVHPSFFFYLTSVCTALIRYAFSFWCMVYCPSQQLQW